VERKCFEQLWNFPDVGREIRRGKQNRYSAEVSSLYLILKHKKLRPEDCRVILIATDSADGIIAARVNKRLIAHCVLGCPLDAAREWRGGADDGKNESLARLTVLRVRGLQVRDAQLLKEQGMEGLERAIVAAGNGVPDGEKILNVTGGFKGIIPIAVSIAWLHGWLPTYLYEETDQLTDLPRPSWVRQEEMRKGPATNIVVYGPLESPNG
jgi:CRISPR/Cas system-associated protein Csm6